MPDISSHRALTTIKALVPGDSGSGKTGALASLAKAGFKLRILDTDRGADILANLLADAKLTPGQVQFETIEDKMKNQGGRMVPDGNGFAKAVKLLEKWSDGTDPSTWGPDTVLVLDSWTSFGRLCLNNTLRLVGKLGNQQPSQPDWGSAINDLKFVLDTIMSDQFKCNVLVLTHVTYKDDDNGTSKPYPNALGAKFPTEMGTYFNNIIGLKISGSGANAKRSVETTALGQLGLKTSKPTGVKNSYPIETGFADFFRDMGIKPNAA